MFKHICAVCVWDTLSLSGTELGLSQNKDICVTCLCTCISVLRRAADAKTSTISELSGTAAQDEKPPHRLFISISPKIHFPTLVLTHIPQPPHQSSSASHQMTSKCIMGCHKTSKREMGAPAVKNTSNDWATHTFLTPFALFLPFLHQPKTNIWSGHNETKTPWGWMWGEKKEK